MALTSKKQLQKFVKVRNSAMFHTNLQFQIDADACGFEVKELGDPVKNTAPNREWDYRWKTRFGTLQEWRGLLSLE
jgi:hypothetical protein